MNKQYQISSKHQVRSILNGLKTLPWFLGALVVSYFVRYTYSFFDPDFVIIFLFWNIVFFLPAFILHSTYYFANRDTKLKVDKETRVILITNSQGENLVRPETIKKVVRIIFNDYRHPEWQQNWIPATWRNYGYLKLITKQNKVFLLTSFMLDPLNPPLEPTETKYNFLPLLDESLEVELTEKQLVSQLRDEIEDYKVKFQHHSEEELRKKTVSNGFRKEVAIAAKELLEERNILANKS